MTPLLLWTLTYPLAMLLAAVLLHPHWHRDALHLTAALCHLFGQTLRWTLIFVLLRH